MNMDLMTVVCTVVVVAMGALALFFEFGISGKHGKKEDKEKNNNKDDNKEGED